ncbi:MAG: TVP38/TMEM64 family protein [Pirellulaceae bacterium]
MGDDRKGTVLESNRKSRRWTIVRRLWWLVFAVSALLAVRSLPLGNATEHLRTWLVELGVWGPVALIVIYVLGTILLIPGSLITLMAGALFGVVVGTIIVSVGSTTGAACAFLIGRYVARDRVVQYVSRDPRFDAIDRAIGQGGWKIVALLRLSPAIPFNLQNYLYGLTSIRFWPCILTSWVAMLPATVLYVYLGHVAGTAVDTNRTRTAPEWVLLGAGLLATVAVTVYLTRLARRNLSHYVQDPKGRPS